MTAPPGWTPTLLPIGDSKDALDAFPPEATPPEVVRPAIRYLLPPDPPRRREVEALRWAQKATAHLASRAGLAAARISRQPGYRRAFVLALVTAGAVTTLTSLGMDRVRTMSSSLAEYLQTAVASLQQSTPSPIPTSGAPTERAPAEASSDAARSRVGLTRRAQSRSVRLPDPASVVSPLDTASLESDHARLPSVIESANDRLESAHAIEDAVTGSVVGLPLPSVLSAVVARGGPVPVPSTVPALGASAVPAATAAASSLIYDRRNRDVTPPVAISRQRFAYTEPFESRLDVAAIDVVVNADGSVASARPLFQPQNVAVHAFLTAALSSVKAWHFTAATKDGAPVRYRYVIPMSALIESSVSAGDP